jgi:hypothetical protein
MNCLWPPASRLGRLACPLRPSLGSVYPQLFSAYLGYRVRTQAITLADDRVRARGQVSEPGHRKIGSRRV